MTSANEVYYDIIERGKVLFTERHHVLCKKNWSKLFDFYYERKKAKTLRGIDIVARGEDENEVPWEAPPVPLAIKLMSGYFAPELAKYLEKKVQAFEADTDSGLESFNDALSYEHKLGIVKSAYEDIAWAAIRYAHGRQTYAPSMVRDSVEKFQRVFPGWEPRPDHTLKADRERVENYLSGRGEKPPQLKGDWLDDLVGVTGEKVVRDHTEMERPANQGGKWLIAKHLK